MEKPFVVIDNPKLHITDLMNGTSEIHLKESDEKFIYSDEQMRQLMREAYGDKSVSSIKHKVGANRDYHE